LDGIEFDTIKKTAYLKKNKNQTLLI